jgi:hypothetical protein
MMPIGRADPRPASPAGVRFTSAYRESARSPGGTPSRRALPPRPAATSADDELDVLVVDRHALVSVHLLDLVDQVLLELADALDLQELLGVLGPFDQRITRRHLLAVVHQQTREVTGGDRVALLGAVVTRDGDRSAAALVIDNADHAGRAGEDGLALRGAGLEELDDAREAVRDVLTGDAAGVEGMVSWVPGSPMDWAAIRPTASSELA